MPARIRLSVSRLVDGRGGPALSKAALLIFIASCPEKPAAEAQSERYATETEPISSPEWRAPRSGCSRVIGFNPVSTIRTATPDADVLNRTGRGWPGHSGAATTAARNRGRSAGLTDAATSLARTGGVVAVSRRATRSAGVSVG